MTLMQVPPKQRINIQPFDLRTQRDAFSVSLDGLKGVCYPAGAVPQMNRVADSCAVEYWCIDWRVATSERRPETTSGLPVCFAQHSYS